MTGLEAGEAVAPDGYRFGPRDQRGLLAGIRTGQAAAGVAGLLGAVLLARSLHGPAAIPVAALVALAGAAAGFVPVAGRNLDEWLPPLAAHLVSRLTGAGAGAGAGAGGAPTGVAPLGQPVPRVFRELDVVEVAVPGRPAFGAVEDRRAGTLTGVLAVAGTAFALLERDEQERRVASWAAALAAVAGGEGAVVRLQWVARTVPGRPLRSGSGRPGRPDPGRPDRGRSGGHDEAARLDHELLVSLSVRASRRGGLGRTAVPGAAGLQRTAGPAGTPGRAGTPSGRGRSRVHARRSVVSAARVAAADAVLARELASLERRLQEAGVRVEGALSLPALCQALRRGFEPGPPQGPAPRRPWPQRVTAGWSTAAVDRLAHRTYWVAEWPRSEVGPDFLLPLLLSAGERRAVSVVMAPVPVRLAVRAAEHARTSATADAELRARHGFALSARARRQAEAVVQREAELAAGHLAFRFSGYVSVTASDEAALERSCARVEQAAALSRLTLRRLDGHQGEALAVCLPVGRGCA